MNEDPMREQIAMELRRQVVEDFRNPTLGAPDLDGAVPMDLMRERADRILALIRDRDAGKFEKKLSSLTPLTLPDDGSRAMNDDGEWFDGMYREG